MLKFLCNIFLFLIIYIFLKYYNNILYGEFKMKKEKNIEAIETENFEVSKTGSLADDLMQFENINDIKILLKKVKFKMYIYNNKFYKKFSFNNQYTKFS